MEHSYNVNIAAKYGIAEAVLLKNLYFWCSKNKANDKNFHDGHYWTYNSVKAFIELFPELSKAKVTGALKKLESEGLIITGNYNANSYDHTTWYSVTNEGIRLLNNADSISEKNPSISENKKSNILESEISITDINTDNKPYINTNNNSDGLTEEKEDEKSDKISDSLFSDFPDDVPRETKKKSKKKNANLKDDDFYKPIYDQYREVFFSNFSGIPNCGKYKDFTDKCISKFRDQGYNDEQIQQFILLAIKNAASDKFCMSKRLPFAMIVSDTVMPRLVDSKANDSPSFGVDFNGQDYSEVF